MFISVSRVNDTAEIQKSYIKPSFKDIPADLGDIIQINSCNIVHKLYIGPKANQQKVLLSN